MTVHRNGYGESAETIHKLDQIRGLFKMHIGICAGKPWARDYRYIDTNAGPGLAPGCQKSGSPLIFLEESTLVGDFRYHACLVERDPGMADALRDRVHVYEEGCRARFGPYETILIEQGDHSDVVPMYIHHLHGSPAGLLFHDPNGVPSFAMLAELSKMRQTQRIDFMIYLTAAGIKRPNGWKANRGRPDTTLADGIAMIQKKVWVIRRPRTNHQWTFLIGTNWDSFPVWSRKGFVRLDSMEGQIILRDLTYRPKPPPIAEQVGFTFEDYT